MMSELQVHMGMQFSEDEVDEMIKEVDVDGEFSFFFEERVSGRSLNGRGEESTFSQSRSQTSLSSR